MGHLRRACHSVNWAGDGREETDFPGQTAGKVTESLPVAKKCTAFTCKEVSHVKRHCLQRKPAQCRNKGRSLKNWQKKKRASGGTNAQEAGAPEVALETKNDTVAQQICSLKGNLVKGLWSLTLASHRWLCMQRCPMGARR